MNDLLLRTWMNIARDSWVKLYLLATCLCGPRQGIPLCLYFVTLSSILRNPSQYIYYVSLSSILRTHLSWSYAVWIKLKVWLFLIAIYLSIACACKVIWHPSLDQQCFLIFLGIYVIFCVNLLAVYIVVLMKMAGVVQLLAVLEVLLKLHAFLYHKNCHFQTWTWMPLSTWRSHSWSFNIECVKEHWTTMTEMCPHCPVIDAWDLACLPG